jgi:hypothetical protein
LEFQNKRYFFSLLRYFSYGVTGGPSAKRAYTDLGDIVFATALRTSSASCAAGFAERRLRPEANIDNEKNILGHG